MKRAIKIWTVLERVEWFNRRQQLPEWFIYWVIELHLNSLEGYICRCSCVLQMLQMNNCHTHKKSQILYPNLFLFSLDSGSPLTGRFHQRVMRLSFILQKVSKKPYFLECAYILHQNITGHSQDAPPKYKAGVMIALFALLLSSGACRKAGLISCSLRTYSHQQKLTYVPHQPQQSLPLLSALLVPTHLLYLAAVLATI